MHSRGLQRCAACVLFVLCGHAAGLEGEMARQPGSELLTRCAPALQLLEPHAGEALEAGQRADAQACVAFVDGFIFGHGWAAWREHRDMYYCPPDGFSAAAAVPVLLEYLRAHPDRLDAPAHVLLFAALSGAFPCTPRSGAGD